MNPINKAESDLFTFVIPLQLSGDVVYRILSNLYHVKPFAFKMLLLIYARLSLFNKSYIRYKDISYTIDDYNRNKFNQSIVMLQKAGFVYHIGLLGCYSITDEGRQAVKEYYRLMKGYVKLFSEHYGVEDTVNDPTLEELL